MTTNPLTRRRPMLPSRRDTAAHLIHGHRPSKATYGRQMVEVVMRGMRRFCMLACAVAAAGVALGTWAVPAASASGGGSAAIGHGATGPAGIAAGHGGGVLRLTTNGHAAGVTTAAPISTRTFAGYQTAVPAGSATVLTTSFTVPALPCTTADLAIAADTGVLATKTYSIAGVFIGCLNGAAVYYPSVVVNGTETDYPTSPVAAGDVIDLTTKVSTNRTRVQVTDVTTGVTQKIIGAGASAIAAWVGDDGWFNNGVLQHVPGFGKVQFQNCVLDGKALAAWHPRAYQRVNSVGTLQIATGGFWPGGTAFTTRSEHS